VVVSGVGVLVSCGMVAVLVAQAPRPAFEIASVKKLERPAPAPGPFQTGRPQGAAGDICTSPVCAKTGEVSGRSEGMQGEIRLMLDPAA
jgi:hypothetical protein